MIPYLLALFWALPLSVVFRAPNDPVIHGKQAGTPGATFVLAVVASVPLVLLLALRRDVGTDYGSYVEIYEAFREGESLFWYEPLYSGLNIFATQFAAAGVVLVFGMSAILSTVPVYWRIFRSSELPALSLVALFGISYPLLQTNAVRSVIAIALLFLALPAVWEGRFRRWFLLGIVAGGFHYTALLILPAYWLLRSNLKVIVALSALCFSIVIAIYRPIAFSFLAIAPYFLPEKYAYYPVQAAANMHELTFGPGFFWYLVNALLVVAFWKRVGDFGVRARVVRNSFFLGLLIIIGMYQFIYVGRIGWFFYIAGVLYWPLVAVRLVGAGRSIFIAGLFFVFLALFLFFSLSGAHDATPYQWILDGHA